MITKPAIVRRMCEVSRYETSSKTVEHVRLESRRLASYPTTKNPIPACGGLRIIDRTSPRHDKSSGTCWVTDGRSRATPDCQRHQLRLGSSAGLPKAPWGEGAFNSRSGAGACRHPKRHQEECARGGGVDGSQMGPTPVAWTGAAMAASHELSFSEASPPRLLFFAHGRLAFCASRPCVLCFRARRLALGKPARIVRADRDCPWPWDR